MNAFEMAAALTRRLNEPAARAGLQPECKIAVRAEELDPSGRPRGFVVQVSVGKLHVIFEVSTEIVWEMLDWSRPPANRRSGENALTARVRHEAERLRLRLEFVDEVIRQRQWDRPEQLRAAEGQ